MPINENHYNEPLWKIVIGTGTVWTQDFYVYAQNEHEAADLVADHIKDRELEALYADYYELADCSETDQSVGEYAEAHNLTCCGNHGIYIEIINIERME